MVGFQEVLKYGRTSGVQLGDYDITVTTRPRSGRTDIRVNSMEEFDHASNIAGGAPASASSTCPSTTAATPN